MASTLIEEYFPKTAEYINSEIVTINRAGHHNWVIEQRVCNLFTPLVKLTKEKIEKLDTEYLLYLKDIDNESE